ncbi:MAG: nicotinate-nucleotide--dimethylbenzimidazole phosphoribosyltransferase [Ezakiella sp.]|nr:nicotinate-nucleotide--dimethylbenzimidazole phosphoribosyltransferase [Ezakiella sp.]
MNRLDEIISGIKPVVKSNKTRAVWDDIAHPIGSLGDLENLTIKIGNIEDRDIPTIDNRVLIVMAGDNGIFEEGVSSGYSELTSSLINSMARTKTASASMCLKSDVDVKLVDMGTRHEINDARVIKHRFGSETKNFAKEPAMDYDTCIDAVMVGVDLVLESDYDLYIVGELGIANTTTSSAIMAALFHEDGKDVVGRGAGLDDEGMIKKTRVIDDAIKKYDLYNKTPLEILAIIGGYEIAGMVGVFLGAAYKSRPVIIDGFIAAVAAVLAAHLNENVKDYLIASHLSGERQMKKLLDYLGLKAHLNMDMRLGEGTGALLMVDMLDTAIFLLKHMGRWNEINIRDELFNIREDD